MSVSTMPLGERRSDVGRHFVDLFDDLVGVRAGGLGHHAVGAGVSARLTEHRVVLGSEFDAGHVFQPQHAAVGQRAYDHVLVVGLLLVTGRGISAHTETYWPIQLPASPSGTPHSARPAPRRYPRASVRTAPSSTDRARCAANSWRPRYSPRPRPRYATSEARC